MTITLVRPTALDQALVDAALGGFLDELEPDDESVECPHCYATAPDEDAARDDLGWTFDEDDRLVCEDCASFDGPTGPYDRAYWG
ncbi:hypothetical protein [Streptomyces sp. NPDC049879]|uniref:hypothetical protein n=1 Tax=Streptomyces sp. NPDC049879 TaxID=3365598 RepID=UPI0037947B09